MEAMMIEREQRRRSFLLTMACLGLGQALIPRRAAAQRAASQGYVLGRNEGEHLVRNGGSIFIKVDPTRGSDNLALGTQQVPVGAGIPIHRHFNMDEAFYVLEGAGTFILNDVRHPVEKGGTIFIPKNAWHGFQNPEQELLLLWIVAPPGLEAFFREIATTPGSPAKPLNREQVNEIARRHHMEFRA
jgi:quercetin dioxygenase-like cupin family protein